MSDKKDIRDYLHLYLGCDCLICYNGDQRGLVMQLTGELIDNPDKDITHYEPRLRRLSDMTEEEAAIADEILNTFEGSNPIEAFQGMANMTLYLLRNKFDVYDLIDSGLAIETKTP